MALSGLNLIVNQTDPNKQGLLQAFNSQVPSTAGTTIREDTVPLYLRLVQPSVNPTRFWDDVDITAASNEVAIDDPDEAPEQGYWKLTFGANTTGNLAYNISAADLQAALNALASITSAGGVTVSQVGLDYIVTWNNNGSQALLTETDVSLYPPSEIAVTEDQAGGSDVPEIQVVSVYQLPAAYSNSFTPLPDAAATVVSTQTGSGSVPSSQQVTLDPAPYDGSLTLTTSLGTTTALAWNASASTVAAALNAIAGASSRYSVTGVAGGPWTISDSTGNNTAITADVSGLIVPIGMTGSLDLNTPAMRARFAANPGENEIELSVEWKVTYSGGGTSTVFQGSINVNKNVIRTVGASGYSPALPAAILQFINNQFSITGFTGGGANNLDGIPTVPRTAGEIDAALVSGKFYFWKLIAGTWPGGSAPGVVQPADYNASTNAKYWQLLTVMLPVFGASGTNHSSGAVPDPGSSAGTTRFLREDATFDVPPTFGASGGSHAPGYVPDPGSSAGTTRYLREDATWDVPSGGGGGSTWIAKNSAYTASAGDKIMADSTGGTFTITLPASSGSGAQIDIVDAQGSWATNNVTVAGTVNGATNLTLNVAGGTVRLVDVGGTAKWRAT